MPESRDGAEIGFGAGIGIAVPGADELAVSHSHRCDCP